MYYNARWYDPVLGRFAQADSIVPGGLQGLDRYAYVANNPIIYTDPSGHAQYHTGNWWSRHGSDHKQKNFTENDIIEYLKATYGEEWEAYYEAWKSDNLFWHMLLHASPGDILVAPTAGLQGFFGTSCSTGVLCFTDANGAQLTNYQGNGPYVLFRSGSPVYASYSYHPDATTTLKTPTWSQPIYDYSTGAPVFTGLWRVVTVNLGDFNPQFLGPSGVPFIVSGGTGLAQRIGSWAGAKFLSVLTPIGNWLLIISALGYLYNSVLRYDQIFDVSIISGPDPRYLVLPAQPPLLGVPQFH